MCTSIKFNNCMGRNYDYEQSYSEQIINLPKNNNGNQYGIIGVCTGLVKEYPLLYDAMNSEGLCCSALAFKGNAHYNKKDITKDNVPSYDFIHYICGNMSDVKSAREYLKNCNITDEAYNEQFPNTDLHWLICDVEDCIVVEQTIDGLKVYDNPYGVLTNNPPFPLQITNMKSEDEKIGLYSYPTGVYESRGVETYGVPGDTTSMSRFHRIHYYKEMMEKTDKKICYDDVSALHLLDNVKQTWGATHVDGKYEYTIYSVVYDMVEKELLIKPYTSTRVKRFGFYNHEKRINL